MTPLTSPESNIKKPRIDELDEPPIQELPPTVASLALCSPSHPSLALSGQVDIPAHLFKVKLENTNPRSPSRGLGSDNDSFCPAFVSPAFTEICMRVCSLVSHPLFFPCSFSSPFANFCTFSAPFSTGWAKFACKYRLTSVLFFSPQLHVRVRRRRLAFSLSRSKIVNSAPFWP